MQTNTDWIPAILMLSVGAVIGIVLMWRVLSAKRAERAEAIVPDVEDLELRDLHAKRDALIQQLRELEDTAVKMTPEQLAHERHDLEIEAARVLRDIDRHVTAEAKAKAAVDEDAAPAAVAMTPKQKGLAWALGIVAVVAVLTLVVWQSASTRGEGEGITGGTGMMGGGGQAAQPDAELQQLQAAVQNDPTNVEAKLDLARAYMMREDLMSVFNLTQLVLQEEPGNARALSYEAIVRLAMGQADVAEKMLDQAIKTNPDLLEARVHMALVHVQTGKFDAAEKDIAEIEKKDKREADALRGLVAQAKQAAAAAPAMGMGGGAPMQAGGAAGGSGKQVSGLLDVDAVARAKVAPGSVIFVILRPSGGGSALAVAKLQASSFPMAFNVGEMQSMSGDPLPAKVRVEARVDADGNPMSKTPTDPIGFVDNVDVGATDVAVVMK